MRCLLGLLASLLLLLPAPTATSAETTSSSRLVVQLVFDQLRGDFISRWSDHFGEGGFKRLTTEGAWFTNCHYPYAYTMTGPGHATMSTGCSPDAHGIIANEWFDRRSVKEAYCAGSDRYTQVPPIPESKTSSKKPYGVAPDRLLVPTFADALKAQLGDQSRVVSLSLKDRSSALPGGRRPDAAYWADKNGQFVTSTFYRDAPHDWVKTFNASKLVDRWFGKNWERLRTDLDYSRIVGPDEVKGEGKGNDQGISFPHPFSDGPKKERANYYAAVANSPCGNEVLLELARKAIVAEKLGQRNAVDFLNLSFSSNDLVGHTWGPDSQEVFDMTLRTDRLIKELLTFLDEKVGKGKYTIVLTADHGICPLPEVSRAQGRDAQRVDLNKILAAAEEYLDSRFPGAPADDKKEKKARWITAHKSYMLYLNTTTIRRHGTTLDTVAQALAAWLSKQPGIARAVTAADLARDDRSDSILQSLRRSYRPDRSGDVMLLPQEYYLLTSTLTGTTHGAPYAYDTHVPLIAFGPGIIPGSRKERVSPEHCAVILARAAGIRPLAHAAVKLPEGLFAR